MYENKSGIYKITSPSAKIYIGQSCNLERRVKHYQKNQCKTQVRIYNSIKKYGWENHNYEIIELCEIQELNIRERFFQDKYNVTGKDGLNCRLTKTNDRSGKLSDETRLKLSIASKGKKKSEAMKQNLSKATKGRTVSDVAKKNMSIGRKGKLCGEENPAKREDVRKKISESLIGRDKGKIQSEEHKRKNSEANMGKIVSDETKQKMREARKQYWSKIKSKYD